MDCPRSNDRTDVLESDSDGDPGSGGGRDLRDVLRGLVVDEGRGADRSLAAVARAARGSERLLPDLLDALDDESTAVRIGAAWSLCALADDRPAVVESVAARVTGRIDGDEPFEVGQVLAYLRGRYPGRVADAVDVAVDVEALDAKCEGRSPGGPECGTRPADGPTTDGPTTDGPTTDGPTTDGPTTDGPTTDGSANVGPANGGPATDGPVAGGVDGRPGNPARVESGPDQDKRIETDGGVPAGSVADLGDGRQVVRPGEPTATDRPDRPTVPSQRTGTRTDPPRRSPASPDDPPRNHPTHPDFESAEDSPAADRTACSGRSTTGDVDAHEKPDTFAAIASLSTLDRLSAVDTGVEDRYATGYRCRAVEDDAERGVAVRLFDRPDEGDRLAFRADLEDCLGRWQALADGESVVDVAEWGARPRPWVRTQPVDTSLAARGRPPVDEAVDQAVDLAQAVAAVHARGGIHGGLDPENVVYPCDPLDALERPMLDNVGLMGVFRRYFEPANYLDPRFAAPEYFDDDFGSVDAATDVYGLGSVVFYLLTGRPPFVGSYGEVRRSVLGERPPAPGEVVDAVLPDRLETVVGKALAKRKLRRYDGVEPMLADLERVRDGA